MNWKNIGVMAAAAAWIVGLALLATACASLIPAKRVGPTGVVESTNLSDARAQLRIEAQRLEANAAFVADAEETESLVRAILGDLLNAPTVQTAIAGAGLGGIPALILGRLWGAFSLQREKEASFAEGAKRQAAGVAYNPADPPPAPSA